VTCVPACGECGQQEEAFPSRAEAVRVLRSCGWAYAKRPEAWQDGYWLNGHLQWYCPPCGLPRDAACMRASRQWREHIFRTERPAEAFPDARPVTIDLDAFAADSLRAAGRVIR
jgi:hypothetical protein